MDKDKIVEIVKLAARLRHDQPVAIWRIEEALSRINAGKAKVSRYENGNPSPKNVYDIALGLF